jgi:hypothetical protein
MPEDFEKAKRGPLPSSHSRISRPGIGRTGTYLDDEILRQLRGKRKYQAFREMRDNEAVVGATLLGIENSIRRAQWRFKPANHTSRAAKIAEFFDTCLIDMDMAWEDVLTTILTFLPYGFAPCEIVLKRRDGVGGRTQSKFSDGRVGWKNWFLVDQGTVDEWVWNSVGDVVAVIQRPPPDYRPLEIPMSKVLLFRTTVSRGSPEGYSILRNAYPAYYRKKKIEEIEAIGIERDLAGLPVVYVPASMLSSNATSDEVATRNAMQEIARDVRRNEQEGIVFPLEYDDDGNMVYKIELLSTGGRRQFQTTAIVERYDARIAMAMLSDFILLGHTGVGSFALAKIKTDMFVSSLKAWISSITSVVNEKAIPQLMQINGFPMELSPTLTASEVDKVDLADMAEYIQRLVASRVLTPGTELEDYTRRIAGLPLQAEDDIDDERLDRLLSMSDITDVSMVVPRGSDNEGVPRGELSGNGAMPGTAQNADGSPEGSNNDGGRRNGA